MSKAVQQLEQLRPAVLTGDGGLVLACDFQALFNRPHCIFTVLTSACARWTEVIVVNKTQVQLEFYCQTDTWDHLAGTLYVSPGVSGTCDRIPADYVWIRVAATRPDGEWVFDHKYTRDEIEKARIVVPSVEPIAPPNDVRVVPPTGPVTPPVAPAVTFVNGTQEKLEFYTMGDKAGALTRTATVSAGTSWETPMPRFGYLSITGSLKWVRVAATGEHGQCVLNHTYTWDDLLKAKRIIVVSSLEPLVSPGKVNVAPAAGAPPPVLPTQTSNSASAPGSEVGPPVLP